MKKNSIWLSYDLGVNGDYESLYIWLDKHDAKECGDSLAYFVYEYNEKLTDELKTDLQAAMKIKEADRVYIIRFIEKEGKSMPYGNFLFGGRHAPPWAGRAPSKVQEGDE